MKTYENSNWGKFFAMRKSNKENFSKVEFRRKTETLIENMHTGETHKDTDIFKFIG